MRSSLARVLTRSTRRVRACATAVLSVTTLVLLLAPTAAGQLPTAAPTASPFPMLIVDALDSDIGHVDIVGLDLSPEGESIVLTMRLAEPVPVGRSAAEEALLYLFALHPDGRADDALGWWVTVGNTDAGAFAGVLADMDAGTRVEPFPGEVTIDGPLVRVVLPPSVLGNPRSVGLCAMASSSDPGAGVQAQDTAPDRASGDCTPMAPIVSPSPSPSLPPSCRWPDGR